jgi:hypothetical protein
LFSVESLPLRFAVTPLVPRRRRAVSTWQPVHRRRFLPYGKP